MKWISVKEALPLNDTFVRVKLVLLWTTWREALFIKNYFVRKGENITKWVTHWMPIKG